MIIFTILLIAFIIYLSKPSQGGGYYSSSNKTYFCFNSKQEYYNSTYYKSTHLSYEQVRMDKGRWGEYLIYLTLKEFEQNGGKFLFNCYLNKDDSTTTETDVILIHPSGVYVFECKNYKGWIFGNENDKFWTQTLYGGNKPIHEKFYNPIWQNNTHIKYLNKTMDWNIKPQSIIVFGDDCELKNIQKTNASIQIVKMGYLRNLMRHLSNNPSQILTYASIMAIYDKLYPLTQVSNDVKQRHIENINSFK